MKESLLDLNKDNFSFQSTKAYLEHLMDIYQYFIVLRSSQKDKIMFYIQNKVLNISKNYEKDSTEIIMSNGFSVVNIGQSAISQ